jgi:Fanconi anemia group M protein
MESQLRTLKDVAGEIRTELGGQGSLDEYGDGSDDAGMATESEGDETEATGRSEEASSADAEAETDAELESAPVEATNGGSSNEDVQSGLASFDGREPGSTADDPPEGAPGDDGDRGDSDEDEETVATARGEGETIEIVADQRELDAAIARDLSTRENTEVRLETLAVGDYVLSDRAVVERKSTTDFVDSLLGEGDRSIFEQVGDAARFYARPIVILEGGGLYEQRNVHPNAIRGALASLAVDFGASVLSTADEGDTADLLEVIARREQETEEREVSVHGEKGAKTLAEQQEYVVASIAEIGPVSARALLSGLGSVEAVMTADEEALVEIEGIGPVTAERITEVTHSTYDPDRE